MAMIRLVLFGGLLALVFFSANEARDAIRGIEYIPLQDLELRGVGLNPYIATDGLAVYPMVAYDQSKVGEIGGVPAVYVPVVLPEQVEGKLAGESTIKVLAEIQPQDYHDPSSPIPQGDRIIFPARLLARQETHRFERFEGRCIVGWEKLPIEVKSTLLSYPKLANLVDEQAILILHRRLPMEPKGAFGLLSASLLLFFLLGRLLLSGGKEEPAPSGRTRKKGGKNDEKVEDIWGEWKKKKAAPAPKKPLVPKPKKPGEEGGPDFMG